MEATHAPRPPLALLRLATAIRWLPYALAAAAFTLARLPGPVATWPDSFVYAAMARTPGSWLAGPRPPVAAMLYAALGGSSAPIPTAQWAIGVACWLALALSAARLCRAPLLRPPAFGLVLLVGASRDVAGWDQLLMSESVALSLLALLVACGLWLAQGWHWGKAAAFVAIAALWVGARDTNGYTLLVAVSLAAPFLLAQREWRRGLWIVAACLLIFGASAWSARAGHRGDFPLHNVIGKRVLTDPARTAWYASHGMPLSPALTGRTDKWANEENYAFHNDPALADFRAWAYDHGQATLALDLLTHPLRAVTDLLPDVPGMLAPDVGWYFPGGGDQAILAGLLLPVAALALAIPPLLRRRAGRRWLLPALVLLSGLATLPLIWHGDAMEIPRHALPAAVQVRIAAALLLVLMLDTLLAHRRSHQSR